MYTTFIFTIHMYILHYSQRTYPLLMLLLSFLKAIEKNNFNKNVEAFKTSAFILQLLALQFTWARTE